MMISIKINYLTPKIIIMRHILFLLALSFIAFSCTEVVEYDTTEDSAISGKYNTLKVIGDFIYAVTDSELVTIDNSNVEKPKEIDRQLLEGKAENLYAAENVLFIGTETDMFIFSIASNGIPFLESETAHIQWGQESNIGVCDPVVAHNDIAYVTLSSLQPDNSDPCGGWISVNELRVYDVENLQAPELLETRALSAPQGLAADGDLLFVTNLNSDTNVFEIDHEGGLQLINTIEGGAHNVYASDGKVMIINSKEIKQYDYSNVNDIVHYATIVL